MSQELWNLILSDIHTKIDFGKGAISYMAMMSFSPFWCRLACMNLLDQRQKHETSAYCTLTLTRN
jgi:hypothetical protein